MSALLDNCKYNPTAGSTTDWTFSSAITGYQTPTLAGVVNGTTYKYFAISADLMQWEIGQGAYNTGTGVLPRTTVLYNSSGTGTVTGQSGAGTKINFTNPPLVAIVAIKEDIISIEEANSFTSTQKAQARTNLATVGAVNIQTFTASGTYTPNANLIFAIIEVQAAGGGGAGCVNATGGQSGGGGGASGGYSRSIETAAAIGASQTVTIGAGGTAGVIVTPWVGGAGGNSSVGSLCTANGGPGGGSNGGNSGQGASPSAPGTGNVVAAPGQPGGSAISSALTTISVQGSFGGSCQFGAGGPQTVGNVSHTGTAGTGFGAGGAGGVSFNGGGAGPGGAGTAGLVIITEYCSQ